MEILIVDDEAAIRQIARCILEMKGHHVSEACNGAEALAFASGDAPLDLLITDLRMPGITGEQVAHRMRVLRPNLKVLFITASAGKRFEQQSALTDGARLVRKPFTARDLIEAVSQV